MMQFKRFHWRSRHGWYWEREQYRNSVLHSITYLYFVIGQSEMRYFVEYIIRPIRPCSTNIGRVPVIFGWVYFYFSFGVDFNETNIPLVFVGYEIIIANSYPTHARGIIVNLFCFILRQSKFVSWPMETLLFSAVSVVKYLARDWL